MGLRQPAPEGAPTEQSNQKNPAEIAANVFSGMSQLMDMMDRSQAVSPEDKKEFATIIQAYQGFIENNLGQAPGQSGPQGPRPMPGPASMEAGVSKGARPMPM